MTFDISNGQWTVFLADAVILCTGGHTRIWKKSSSRKEADLRGAIDNEQNSTKNDKEKESSKQKVDDSSNDYQLSRAFDLILALDLANNN